MEKQLEGEISPLKLARTGARLRGRIALARLPRLLACVERGGEGVELALEFSRDIEDRSLVQGTLRASVDLICQRCLEVFTQQLEIDVHLGFVTSDEEAKALPEGLEACLLTDGVVILETLIEDELLLGLPDVPLHPREACPAGDKFRPLPANEKASEGNPFAVLGQLKGKVN